MTPKQNKPEITKRKPNKPEISQKSLDRYLRMQAIGTRIKQKREEAGLSQRELGERLGISSGAVGQWEIGRTPPTMENLDALCGVLDVSRDWLMTGEKTPERETVQTQEEKDALIVFRQLDGPTRKAMLQLMKGQIEPKPGKPGRKKENADEAAPPPDKIRGRKATASPKHTVSTAM